LYLILKTPRGDYVVDKFRMFNIFVSVTGVMYRKGKTLLSDPEKILCPLYD